MVLRECFGFSAGRIKAGASLLGKLSAILEEGGRVEARPAAGVEGGREEGKEEDLEEAAALASVVMSEMGGDARKARFLLAACAGGEGGREKERGESVGGRLRRALKAFAEPPPVYPSLPPSFLPPHLMIVVKDPSECLRLAKRAVGSGLRVSVARHPCHVLSEVVEEDEVFFQGMVLEADFSVVSGLEAAMKFRTLPSPGVGEGRGKEGGQAQSATANLMMVMVVNGSPHANYSGASASLSPSLPPSFPSSLPPSFQK